VMPFCFSCAQKTPSDGEGSGTETETNVFEEYHRDPGLEYQTFDNRSFRILASTRARDVIYNEEVLSDVINESVHDRNVYVEDVYGVEIVGILRDDINFAVHQSVFSGIAEYDIVENALSEYAVLIDRGELLDLHSIPYLDLSKEWWDADCVENMSVAHSLYFCTGDIMITDEMGCWAITYNRDIATNNNLPNLYELVDAHEWTYDRMYALAAGVSDAAYHDKMDYFSITWGIISENANSYMMWQGSGYQLIVKDKDSDIPAFSPLSESSYDAMVKIYTMQKDKNVTLLDSDIVGVAGDNVDDRIFSEGHALFDVGSMSGVESMREYDMDFGVLPMPKLDDTIPNYYASMNPSQTYAVAIPSNSPDLAFTGYITQVLGCESVDTLLEAYYEKTLVHKGLRKEDDEKMLDLIFQNRVFDLSQVFSWASALMQEIGSVKNTGRLKSLADAYETSINKQINTFLTKHGLA